MLGESLVPASAHASAAAGRASDKPAATSGGYLVMYLEILSSSS